MTATKQAAPTGTTVPQGGASRFAGIAFLFVFIAAFVLLVTGPTVYEGSLAEYGAGYADGGREWPVSIASFFLLPIAAGLLVWAVAHIATGVDRALGRATVGGRVATIGAGVMAASLTAAGAATVSAEHLASGRVEGFPVDASTAYGMDLLSSALLNLGLWGGSAVLIAIGVSARGAGLVPGWLLWAGIVVAPLLTIAFMFGMLPLLAFLLWVAVVGFMVRPAPRPAGTVG